MRRADRLFRIVLLLGRERASTARELAEQLEVSMRTVYRDVADLMASGVPVEGEAGVGYRLRAGWQLPALMFDDEELQALLLGVRMVKAWADPALARAADTALAKIEAVLPAPLRVRPLDGPLIVPDFRVRTDMLKPLALLREAIRERRKLRFDYRRADDAASHRVVWPLGLFFWGEVWTLGAWCELRGEFRTFRPDRMGGLEMLGESFSAKEGLALADYMRDAAARSLREGCTPSSGTA